jgi:predicted dehydrogenase
VTVGVGVVGADPSGRGFGARAHVPAVLALEELTLAAVCTAREETARAAAERWGAPRGYSDYREAVTDPDVDLVTIAVRVALHAEIAEAALEAGKAVYCEWPLGLGSADAAPLAGLAAARGLAAGVGTQGRFAPAVAVARDLLARGDIGNPLSFQAAQLLPRFAVESDRWWLAREDQGSGALHVATAHVTDTLQSLLGPISSLAGARATRCPADHYADSGAPFDWTASDTVAYVARIGDLVGSAHVTNTADPGVGFSLRILGDEGQLLLTAPGYPSYAAMRLRRGRPGGGELEPVAVAPPEGVELSPADRARNVALALRAFVGVGASFRPSFEDGVALHRLLEAIARSSDERVWVELGV